MWYNIIKNLNFVNLKQFRVSGVCNFTTQLISLISSNLIPVNSFSDQSAVSSNISVSGRGRNKCIPRIISKFISCLSDSEFASDFSSSNRSLIFILYIFQKSIIILIFVCETFGVKCCAFYMLPDMWRYNVADGKFIANIFGNIWPGNQMFFQQRFESF